MLERLENINKAYREILGRDADKTGLASYAESNKNIEEIRKALKRSSEYKIKKLNPIFKIQVIGNCQAEVASKVISFITNSKVYFTHIRDFNNAEESLNFDLLFYQSSSKAQKIIDEMPESVKKISFPSIGYMGIMQDCVYSRDSNFKSPIFSYHSFIVITAYLLGFKEDECYLLFNDLTYKKLGYFHDIDFHSALLKKQLKRHNVSPGFLDEWLNKGDFMWTVNHPKLFVIQDIIKDLFLKNNIKFSDVDASRYINDNLAAGPVYPILINPLSRKSNLVENLVFRSGGKNWQSFNLKEFIAKSYEIYRKSNQDIAPHRFDEKGADYYKEIYNSVLKSLSRNKNNPYRKKPDYCFWRKSISTLSIDDVDPVVSSKYKILKNKKIATAGSCFAQHIAKRLNSEGFNYYVVENAPTTMSSEEQLKYGYGVFSARYGNIYTTRQLVQIFEQAFDKYQPIIEPWEKPEGGYVDPFRPNINPDGFATPEEVIDTRKEHLRAVRKMFEELDVFVFTLGLTECWEHVVDGAILPVAPGVIAGDYDKDKYNFRNFNKDDVKNDLLKFIDNLKEINPSAQIILTVSPVPLVATHEDRHVLVSTTVSKSILRVVADEVTSEKEQVHYFPSYEIITGNFNKGSYYQEDLREIKPEGVDHVMRLFIQHMTEVSAEQKQQLIVDKQVSTAINSQTNNSKLKELEEELKKLNEVVCEEELLDR